MSEDNKDTPKLNPQESRKDAISKAIESADKVDRTTEAAGSSTRSDKVEDKSASSETTKASPAKEDKKSGDASSNKDEKSGLDLGEDKELLEQGKQLMLALKDPQKAGIVIKFLAEQHGYSKIESKAEVKEVKNEIVEDLKESLGEEFSFLADKLAPGIEKILKKQLELSQKDIREEFQKQEQEKLRTQSSATLESLSDDFFGKGETLPDPVAQEMSKYMDRVAPSASSSVREYVTDAFHAAIGKLGLNKIDKNKQARVERARTDAASRLSGASERVPSEESIKSGNSKPLTRQQAIQAAIDQIDKEN